MRIAVSVPDDLNERADALAAEQHLSRSEVYAQAIQEFLDNHRADPAPADPGEEIDPFFGTVAARRLIEAGDWAW